MKAKYQGIIVESGIPLDSAMFSPIKPAKPTQPEKETKQKRTTTRKG